MKEKKNKKKSSFFSEFKAFLNRGNVINLAVAVVVGAAFGKIVSALVDHIIMPLLSLILGGANFSDLKWVIRAANPENGITETALGYGAFIQAMLDFFIIALCIFIVVRLVAKANNKLSQLKKKMDENSEPKPDEVSEPQEAPPSPAPQSTQEELLVEIRDLLKAGNITINSGGKEKE